MRLTRFGFKGLFFYLTLVGAFFASPYSNLFFLLLAFLTLQWALCPLWTWRNMRGVTAGFEALEPACAGVGATARVRIRAGPRARFELAAELELESGERVAAQADVMDAEALVSVPLPALPRGLYELRRARVRSTFPLGLFAAQRSIVDPPELVVYPAPTELANARNAGEALAEVLGERASGAGDLQPSGLRDHREGDEPRAVHWRATARRGALVVKEHEGGGGDGLEVVIDRRCEPAALEEALSMVSALVSLARANKEALVLHSQGLQATFGPGHRPWRDALRFLAGAEALAANAPAPPPVSPSVTRLPMEGARAR